MLDQLLWDAFSSTIVETISINGKEVKAIVLKNPLETDLETGTTYRANKTVLVLDFKYKGHFKEDMPVSVGCKSFKIRAVFEEQDEIRIELKHA